MTTALATIHWIFQVWRTYKNNLYIIQCDTVKVTKTTVLTWKYKDEDGCKASEQRDHDSNVGYEQSN